MTIALLIVLPFSAYALNDRGVVVGGGIWRSGNVQAIDGGAFDVDNNGDACGISTAGATVWAADGEVFVWPATGAATRIRDGLTAFYDAGETYQWHFRGGQPIRLQPLEDGGGAVIGGIWRGIVVGTSSELVNDNGHFYGYVRPVWWDEFGHVHRIEYEAAEENVYSSGLWGASNAGMTGSINLHVPRGAGREDYISEPVCWDSPFADPEYMPWAGSVRGIASNGVTWGWIGNAGSALWYDGTIHQPTWDGTIPPQPGPWVSEILGVNARGWLLLRMNNGESWLSIPGGVLPGDINGDGRVDNFDIDPFVGVLLNPNVDERAAAADMDGDGRVDNFDIAAFVAALVGP